MLIRIVLLPLMGVSTFFKVMPPSLIVFLGSLFGTLLRCLGFRYQVVSQNLDLAFSKEKTPEEIRDLKKKVFQQIGTLFLEIVRNFTVSREQMLRELYVAPDILAKIDAMKAKNQGAVFISAHIANWELFACGMAGRGYPVSIIGKRMSNPISQALIEQRRLNTGVQMIYAGKTIEKMKATLNQGGMIGFMVDQHMGGKKSINANFFGHPVGCIRSLVGLVRDTGCPIIPMCAFRNSDGTHFVKMLDELPYLQAEDSIVDPEERILREEWLNTQQYQNAIEQLVRFRPEQWLWMHRRWKTNPQRLQFEKAHLQQDWGLDSIYTRQK